MNEAYAEESVIGSLIVSEGGAMDMIPAKLDCSMFSDEICATAFGIFQAAAEKSEKVGVAVFVQRLVARSGFAKDFIESKARKFIGMASESTIESDANEIITSYKARHLSNTLNRIEITPDNLAETMDYLTMVIYSCKVGFVKPISALLYTNL